MYKHLGSGTHDELTALIVDILLQRCLTQMSDKVGANNLETYLIIHHDVANILNQATEPIYIPGAVEEPCDLASLLQ